MFVPQETARSVNGERRKIRTLRLPSGEMRMVPIICRASIGVVGNGEHNLNIGKAGRKNVILDLDYAFAYDRMTTPMVVEKEDRYRPSGSEHSVG